MTEPNHEASQKHDLTGALARVPTGFVELLGAEDVGLVEHHAELATGLLEFSRLPDPFAEYPSRTERLVTPEVEAALTMIHYVRTVQNSADPKVSLISRDQAPVLRAAVKEHLAFLRDNLGANTERMGSVSFMVESMDLEDSERIAREIPSHYDTLGTIARDMASPAVLHDTSELIIAEYGAGHIDAKNITLQRRPHVKDALDKLDGMIKDATARRETDLVEEMRGTYYKLSSAAGEKGRKNWRVRKAHRSTLKINADDKVAQFITAQFEGLQHEGSHLYGQMVVAAHQAMEAPSMAMFSAVVSLKEKLMDINARAQELGSHEVDEATGLATIAAEAYIAQKAEQAQQLLREAGVKLSETDRRAMHEAKDTAIQRDLRRLGQALMTTQDNPLEGMDADPDFRQACRTARDILAGGRRINHPEAERLAKELHGVRFGRDRKVALEPEESGLVIGIVTNQVHTLLGVIDRIEAAKASGEDAQVVKLHQDLPEQHLALSTYRLNVSLEKLKSLLDDSTNRQLLLNPLRDPEAARRVRETIEALWRQRVLGETEDK